MVVGVGLRLYKAVHTGIVYDEMATLSDFGLSYHDALNSYVNPNNNHVINSLLVNFGRAHFANVEHFFRLHAVAFGALYCVSAAYLAWTLVQNRLLRVLLAILLMVQYSVFDLSYLARGYSIALGSLYFGLAAIVFLLRRPVALHLIWIPVLVIAASNVLTLGSMLSAVAIVGAMNICYLAMFSHRVLVGVRRLPATTIQFTAIGVCSLGLLYAIYCHLWRDILAARDNFGTVGLGFHLKEVLAGGMFASWSVVGCVAYAIVILLSAIGACYAIRRASTLTAPQSFVLLTMVATLAALFIWRNVLGLSLGFARNGVFLIPLFLMCCVILIDIAAASVNRPMVRKGLIAGACAALGVMAYAARPSLEAVQVSNWRQQSVCGPLLRQLRAIDPERNWSIALSDRTRTLKMPLLYYSHRGYHIDGPGPVFDVSIYAMEDKETSSQWYKPEYFDDFHVRIYLSPNVRSTYRIPVSDFGAISQPALSR